MLDKNVFWKLTRIFMNTQFPSSRQASCLLFHFFVYYTLFAFFLIFQKYFSVYNLVVYILIIQKSHLKNIAQILSLKVPYVIPVFSTVNIYFQRIISRWLLLVIFLKMLFHTEKISYWNIQYIFWMNLIFLCANKSW